MIRYNYCMALKDTFALGRQGGHTEVGPAPDAIHSAMTLLVGAQTRPLPLGRFLLSSTGFHLILVWTVVSFGLPKIPSVPRPLVVTLIGSENSEPSAPSGHPDRTRTRQAAAPGQVAPPASSKAIAQPRIASPPPIPPPRRGEGKGEGARPLSAPEVPTAIEAMMPKAVGISAGGSHAVGERTPGSSSAVSLSSGPVLLGPDGDGEAFSGSASRGGVGRLDAALVAPRAPTVTVGSPQGAAGGGTGRAGSGAAGGGYAAPNYGINPLPRYPPLAREKGYEGTVYLRVLVRADGRVGQLTIDRSSGYEILDREAVNSVKGWAFLPAKKGGKPVESWVLLPVKFALN